jgi:putative spermidine/putrescine transport system substrate-binding protein
MTRRFLIFLVVTMLAVTSLGTGPEAAPARTFEQRYRTMTWDEILADARGKDVFFFMWGGSAARNTYVNDLIALMAKRLYDINVRQVPVGDIVQTVNRLVGEKQAGNVASGGADLMWINGENFRTAREAGLLFGPWSDLIPNAKLVNWSDPSVSMDFGYPVDYYESPWASAQFVFDYDSAKIQRPPATVEALFQWIRQNPGRFAYPAPPDFNGSAFVRHIFYWAAGGHRRLMGPFNESVYREVAPKTWQALNEIEPFLWRRGQTYPESNPKAIDLFADGEVDFALGYGSGRAANNIATGRYPRTVRSHVFDTGTIGNTNYVAIAFNTPRKSAAMVLANLLLSPEAQYEAAKPEVLAQPTPLDIARLSKIWQDKFAGIPRHEATLPASVLGPRRLPEMQATWLQRIERDWIANVLQR